MVLAVCRLQLHWFSFSLSESLSPEEDMLMRGTLRGGLEWVACSCCLARIDNDLISKQQQQQKDQLKNSDTQLPRFPLELLQWSMLNSKRLTCRCHAIMQQKLVPCLRKGGISVRVGVKELHMGDKLRYALIITHEAIQILDLLQQDVCAIIRRSAYPRSARISRCERIAVCYFTDNTVGIYRTADGTQISKVVGVPRSANSFVLSGNGQRLLFANNQTLCLWSVPRGQLEISSNQWRNINCYALRDDGKQIAIGTYSGALVVLTLMSVQRVTEMELKRHKNCVMLIAYCRSGAIISVSYDRLFVKATVNDLPTGAKGISYEEIILQTIPRSLHSAGGHIFFAQNDGSIGWLTNGNKVMQYSDGMYTVTEHEGNIVFMRYKEGEIEWFGRAN